MAADGALVGLPPLHPRPGTLLGPGPIPGLWLATGHHRNGVLLAAITAELLAGAIHGDGEPTLAWALEAFRWGRFSAPAPRQATPA